jgi:hypothetical protein
MHVFDHTATKASILGVMTSDTGEQRAGKDYQALENIWSFSNEELTSHQLSIRGFLLTSV